MKILKQRLSQKEKNKDKQKWFKEQIDYLDKEHVGELYSSSDTTASAFSNMKTNYDLFNNKLNLEDFKYVCNPFGEDVGELPARMVNRDIVSGKIKAMLGMEMKRPFSWKVIATNPEATSRKEREELNKIKEFVENQIMLPIRQQIELEKQQLEGQKIPEEQKQKILQEIEQKSVRMTPPEIKKYMEREHQDPVEIMSHQLLEYLIKKTDFKRKMNKAFKHSLISGKGIIYVGELNGEPEIWNINPLRFSHDMSSDNEFIEEGEWACCEYKMNPSEIVKYFGDELTNKEIDSIYETWSSYRDIENADLFKHKNRQDEYQDNSSISVVHCVWKSLRKIGFLKFLDENGEEKEMLVNENYELNADQGDVDIEWEWIPEICEGWKIKIEDGIYVKMRPVPGQFKDIENIYECKLPYYGVIHDNVNSEAVSLMDRLKVYQYYYNIIWYRLEILLASDKGKKILMNINAIPDSAGIDIKKWQYFMESTPYMWYNPDEEGASGTYQDANTVAKVMDLSLVSDIKKYMDIAEYIKQQAGKSVGITEQVEGQIGPNESVRNTQQSLIQSSHILEMYFDMHNHLKKNVLTGLLETAKVVYSQGNKKRKISYILDDMSQRLLDIDVGLLDNSTLGIFVSDSTKSEETKEAIRQLTHAAMQNQKVELSDVISVIRQESPTEAEEVLKVAEKERKEYEQNAQAQQQKAMAEESEKARQRDREKFEEEKEIIILKEEERRKTEMMKSSLMAASFNPELDKDNDGKNDFLEMYKLEQDLLLKQKNTELNEKKFEHQKNIDEKKLQQEKEKLKQNSKNKK